MSQAELVQLADSIDQALAVFKDHKPDLTAREVSVKSMLIAVNYQVRDQLQQERTASARSR